MFKKNRNLMYLVLIIIFSVIFFFEKKQFDETLAPIESEDSSSANSKSNAFKAGSVSQKSADSTEPAAAPVTDVNDTPESLKKFQTWFSNEAANLESRGQNQKDKEAELRAKAQALTPSEINSLKEKSYATDVSANERILATYLLSLGGDQTSSALVEISQRKLSLPSPQPVHSTGETQLMQEKAIRTMAIDELFSRAKSNPTLRPTFLQMANQIPDANLRNYALKRYAELK